MLSVETDGCRKPAAELAEGVTGGSSQRAQRSPRGSLVTRGAAEIGATKFPTSNGVAGPESDGRPNFNSVRRRPALAAADGTVFPPAVGNRLAVAPDGVAAAGAHSERVSDDGVPFKRWPSMPSSPSALAVSYGASARPVFGSVGSTTSTDSASTVFSAIIEGHELDFPRRPHRSASTCQHVADDYAQRGGARAGLELGGSGSGGDKIAKDEFEGLPAEIKVRVFTYLKAEDLIKVSRVSRGWNTLAYDGALWSRVDAQAFYSKISKDKIEQLFSSAGEFLRAAKLRGCSQITSSTLRRMADACPNLAELDLEGCSSVSSRGLAHALSGLRKLRKFHAAGLLAVTDDVLEQLAVVAAAGGGPPPLESLIITRCRKVTAVGITRVVNASPRLSTLSIGGCRGLNDAALEAIGSSSCTAHLRQLSLAWCVSITDAGIVKLVFRAAPPANSDSAPSPADRSKMSLESLDLTGCVQVGDVGVSAVCSASPGLRFLDLEDCRLVTDASLRALANSNPRLELLSLAHCEGVRDEGVSLVLAGCSLKRLSLDCCPMVTSATLRRVVELARHCAAPAAETPATAGPAALPVTPDGHDSGGGGGGGATAPSMFRLHELEVNDCIAVSSNSVSEATSEVPSLQVRCFYTWQARVEEESRRTRAAGSAADATVSAASSDSSGSDGDSRFQGSRGQRHGICNIL